MLWERGEFLITSDPNRVDIDALHAMLSQTYWARNRSRDAVEKSVSNSLCFSIFRGDEQIGFVRAITDGITYAVILDMIIRKDFRGRGLGKWLVQCLGEHPEVIPLRQVLWTVDADDFYRQSGFEEMSKLKFMARSWKM